MAYQVISQNNTTTTLADENGNIIRVPARVSLATSTDYTIKKVNNSTATLEDGNGNIIRDVPCVAVLVGGEGGGGGAVSSVNGQTGDVVITGNDVLPDQTGQSGKFLTTDGTDASWSDKPLVDNGNKTASGHNFAILGGTATTRYGGIAIGDNSIVTGGGYSVACGNGAQVNTDNSKSYGTAIGCGARISNCNGGTVIGCNAIAAKDYVIAIGAYANANGGGSKRETITIGFGANAKADYAIQLGHGDNTEASTFCVATKYNNDYVNYKLLDADGTIPAARHASIPAADGTYTLQLVISNGVPTLSWVAV